MTKEEFNKKMDDLMGVAFDNTMFNRFKAHTVMNGTGLESLKAFKETVEMFGSEEQCKAFGDIVELVENNPEFSNA